MARGHFSPLTILLGAVFFFSAHVLAVSAVLGVDLGTEYIKAALVKPGIPLEIVLTKDSRRKETSAVVFKPPQNGPKAGSYPERAYGSDAMAIAARFPGDVYPNLKALLGLPLGHPAVQDYAARHPALQLEEKKAKSTVAFKSKAFAPEVEAWMVEELLAMQLQSIQKNAEAAAGPDTSIRSIVLTVPPFYTTEERRAVQLAADLAGLKVLSLITDGLAVGVNYATTRQFPNVKEGGKPEHHLVFDMGAGSTKATVLKFQSRTIKDIGKYNKTVQEVAVLGSGWDRTLGGDALNGLIVDDMVAQFIGSPAAQKISATAEKVMAHGRAVAKLTKEAERLRHILSANSNTQASFEGLYDDVDFKYKITRANFEKMADSHAERVRAAINSALKMANLDMIDLTSIILHGGATRTPFVQKELEKIAGSADKIRTNVNSDESAVFGAGFRAADLSPSFRVKEIRASEAATFSAGMRWTNAKDKAQHQRLWTPTSQVGSLPKEVTFSNHDDFTVTFYQQCDSEEKDTRVMATKNLTATVAMLKEKHSCTDDDIHFKVSMRLASENSEVEVVKATVECETETPEKEGFVDGVKNFLGLGKKDQQPLTDDDTASGAESASSADTTSTSTSTTESTDTATSSVASAASAETSAEPPAKKKRLVVIPVKYTVENTGTPELSNDELKKAKDRLKAFEASDRERIQREEALNQLESFAYKARELLQKEDFVAHSTAEERATLEKKASDAGEWLYGDGTTATKKEFQGKLKELQDIANRVTTRIDEASKRPEVVAGLKDALNGTSTFLQEIRRQIKEYDDWHSSASASATKSPASSSGSVTVAPAEPSGDFDGLEDDAVNTPPADPKMEDILKERGPVPPMYKVEDLAPVEKLFAEVSKWLKDMEDKQNALPPTTNPVLLIKDLTSRREKLDKAGMDLAMKSVKNFQARQKKGKSSSSKAKTAGKGGAGKPSVTINAGANTKTADGDNAQKTIDLGGDGESFIKLSGDNLPSDDEIQEMLKNIKVDNLDKDKNKDKDKGKGKGERKHDEL